VFTYAALSQAYNNILLVKILYHYCEYYAKITQKYHKINQNHFEKDAHFFGIMV